MAIDLRTHYLESIRDISEFVQFGQSEYRIVAGSKHLRNLLIDELVRKVNASVRVPIEFRFDGMPGNGATEGVLADWQRDPFGPNPAAPVRSLREFRQAAAYVEMDRRFTVETIIRVAANGDGGVHWGSVTKPVDVDFVKATAGASMNDATMDGFSVEASILPAIARVALDGLGPLTAAVQARSSL